MISVAPVENRLPLRLFQTTQLYMSDKIALSKIGTELATLAAQLQSITVRIRSGNFGIGAGTIPIANITEFLRRSENTPGVVG